MPAVLPQRIDAYCDTVPRVAARAEEHGPFTLSVRTAPGPITRARGSRRPGGHTITPATSSACAPASASSASPGGLRVAARVAPELAAAAEAAGLRVHHIPARADAPSGAARPRAAGRGAAADPRGPDARPSPRPPSSSGSPRAAPPRAGWAPPSATRRPRGRPRPARVRAGPAGPGHIVMAVAEGAEGVVGGGTASPRGYVAELAGIATLPAARRAGAARAVTEALVAAVSSARRGDGVPQRRRRRGRPDLRGRGVPPGGHRRRRRARLTGRRSRPRAQRPW